MYQSENSEPGNSIIQTSYTGLEKVAITVFTDELKGEMEIL